MEVNALHRLRSAQGILGLADKHGPARLEAACARAITAGDPSYRTIKGILAAGLEREPAPPPPGDGGAAAFLHGPALLFAHLATAGQDTTMSCPARRARPRKPAMTRPVTVTDRTGLPEPAHPQTVRHAPTLDARLAQAAAGELGHLDFLQVLCDDEISRRAAMSMARRIRRARFDEQATLEGFDFPASPKLPAAQIRDLAALRWLHAGESVILYGPVGVGKSHIAQALGHLAIRAGADVRFTQNQPHPGRPGRRPRRPHLGPPPPRIHPPRRPHPRRLRHARAHRRPSRRPLRADQRTRTATR